MISSKLTFMALFGLLLVLFISLCHPNVSLGGDFYRWVDEDGVSHYSDAPPATPSSNGKNIPVKTLRQHALPGGQYQEFVIPFDSIGQGMLVNVMINNYIPARMLVDTGASAIKINAALLKRLNQDLPDDRRRGKVVTAAGMANAEEVFIEKIDVGVAVKENVQAFFMHEAYDNADFDGLLGMSFLSDFQMTVDYKNNQIHLKR